MTNSSDTSDVEERMKLARQVFLDYPDKIPAHIQDAILAQRVILEMAPYDAYLAAGQFAFRVIADQSKWPTNSDPYQVMWAQSLHPDASQIWMTFQTKTQYPNEGRRSFRVFFRNGRAVEIKKLGVEGDSP